MKRTGAALLAYLGLRSGQKKSTCVRVERKDGEIVRVTDSDSEIVLSGWPDPDASLNGTYTPRAGFKRANFTSSASLEVGNTEVIAPQVAPAILELDMRAGIWDRAKYKIFEVNRKDLTMGPHYVSPGWIAEMTTGTGEIKIELRDLMLAYMQTLGVLTSPTCRNDFCDAMCTLDAADFTSSGTIEGFSPDGLTIYDSARTEPAASDGVAIVNISNGNPCVVTLADGSLNLVNGQPVILSGIVGMELLNVPTLALNPSGNTFELSIDTTDTGAYGTYLSGGTVIPVGGGRSFFEDGKVTFLTGLNAGLSQDVKISSPGQFTLIVPMGYPLNGLLDTSGDPIPDTYEIVRGCGKNFVANCIGDYDNGVNFNGEPYQGGNDDLIQVGRSA